MHNRKLFFKKVTRFLESPDARLHCRQTRVAPTQPVNETTHGRAPNFATTHANGVTVQKWRCELPPSKFLGAHTPNANARPIYEDDPNSHLHTNTHIARSDSDATCDPLRARPRRPRQTTTSDQTLAPLASRSGGALLQAPAQFRAYSSGRPRTRPKSAESIRPPNGLRDPTLRRRPTTAATDSAHSARTDCARPPAHSDTPDTWGLRDETRP